MSWSYSGNPSASALDEVRFLTADTDQTKPWTLQDAEITYNINLSPGNRFLAAAWCAEQALGKLKGIPTTKSVGDLSLSYSGQFQFFSALACSLRARATLAAVKPFVGGTSYVEKATNDANPDRVQPAAKVGGMDKEHPANSDDEVVGS